MVDESTIMAMHRENRADIGQLKDDVSAIREEQMRVATLQEGSNKTLDRLAFILEGDGNGNMGQVRKVDSLIETRDQAVALAKKVWDICKTVVKWAIPIGLAWMITWFSSPQVRKFVNQFTTSIPPIVQSHQQQDSGIPPPDSHPYQER